MAEEPVDYSHIYDFLYRIERRIGYLEKDAAFIEKRIIHMDENKIKNFNALKANLAKSHSNVTALKNNFNQCINRMTSLGKNLKNTVKKEEIQELNNQLDEIKFEEYVTQKDLIRGI